MKLWNKISSFSFNPFDCFPSWIFKIHRLEAVCNFECPLDKLTQMSCNSNWKNETQKSENENGVFNKHFLLIRKISFKN